MKLAGSVETIDQTTTLGPLVVQPVLLVGSVIENASAEAARAKRTAMERMTGELEESRTWNVEVVEGRGEE